MHGSNAAGTELHAFALAIHINRCFLNVGRKLSFGFVLCVANIVAGQAALAGQFADARHGVSRSNSGPPAHAEGQLNLWDDPGKARG